MAEFIRRFLLHVLPKAFTASATTASSPAALAWRGFAQARQLLAVAAPEADDAPAANDEAAMVLADPCPCCGGRMIVIDTFAAGCQPSHPPIMRIDTS